METYSCPVCADRAGGWAEAPPGAEPPETERRAFGLAPEDVAVEVAGEAEEDEVTECQVGLVVAAGEHAEEDLDTTMEQAAVRRQRKWQSGGSVGCGPLRAR